MSSDNISEAINMPGIPNNFIYIVLFLSVMYISVNVIKAKAGHIFGIVIASYLIYQINQKNQEEFGNFNKELDSKLELIGNPSNFYIDANFINLYYSIYAWKSLNPSNYTASINAVNNVLQLELDTGKGLKDCKFNYDVAYTQSRLALNTLNGLNLNIDNKLMFTKLKTVIERLHELLTRHLYIIKSNCDKSESKKSSLDINSRFIQDLDGPKGFDNGMSEYFDLY